MISIENNNCEGVRQESFFVQRRSKSMRAVHRACIPCIVNIREWCNDWYDEHYYEKCKAAGTVTPLWGR